MVSTAPQNLRELVAYLDEHPWVEISGKGSLKERRVRRWKFVGVCDGHPTCLAFESGRGRSWRWLRVNFLPSPAKGGTEIWFSADGFRIENCAGLVDAWYCQVEKKS